MSVLLALVPFVASQAAIVLAIAWFAPQGSAPALMRLLAALLALGCAVADVPLARALLRMGEEHVRRSRLEVLAAQRVRQLRCRADVLDEERRLRDLRSSVAAEVDEVRGLLAGGDRAAALGVLDELMRGAAAPVRAERLCDNLALDALAVEKIEACRRRGLSCSVLMAVPADTGLPDEEVCVVFSAAADLVTCACATGGGTRVEVRARMGGGYLVMRVSGDGRLGEEARRGWDARIARRIVEQRDGVLRVSEGEDGVEVLLALASPAERRG